MDLARTLVDALVVAVPTVFAIVAHEAAHGWAADRLGDDTARRAGRISLNPVRHVDLLGTIMLPALLWITSGFAFGWAKPVPVNFARLRNPKTGMILIAAAGPGANLVLATLSGLSFALIPVAADEGVRPLIDLLVNSVAINVALTVLNLIPVPPLDGGRILIGLLPRGAALRVARGERLGMFVLIGLLVVLPLIASQFGVRFDVLGPLLEPAVNATLQFFAVLTGHG